MGVEPTCSRTGGAFAPAIWPATAMGFMWCGGAAAQWTPIRLAQDGDGHSQVNAIVGGRQGGYRSAASGLGGPGVWSGSATSWQTLSGGRNGAVYAMWGDMQGGQYQPPGGGIWASIWQGTPQSQLFLHPGGVYEFSEVQGMHGTQQVGTVLDQFPTGGARQHAALWSGTASSFVNLEPPNVIESNALGTDGHHQYGWVRFADRTRAVMWSGTAGSVVSLDPGVPYSGSQILAAAPGRQAGTVNALGWPGPHAAAWSGSAASFIDLNPAGFVISEALGTCESAVVGAVTMGPLGGGRPAIWLGPALTFQELPVPAGYDYAIATCVEFYNGQYYVGGYAVAGLGPNEAFVWVGVPAPGSITALAIAGLFAARTRRR